MEKLGECIQIRDMKISKACFIFVQYSGLWESTKGIKLEA
jgi:hypothetical protein